MDSMHAGRCNVLAVWKDEFVAIQEHDRDCIRFIFSLLRVRKIGEWYPGNTVCLQCNITDKDFLIRAVGQIPTTQSCPKIMPATASLIQMCAHSKTQ